MSTTTQPSRLSLLRLFAPHVPNLLLKSASHFLSLTPQSQYWDLRTTLTVEFIRAYLGQSKSVTVEEVQATTVKRLTVGEGTWVVHVEVPVQAGEEVVGLEEVVRRAVVALGDRDVERWVPRVGVVGITGEWVGAVLGKEVGEEWEGWSEERKYRAMMEGVEGGEDSGVVLWLHEGAYWLCDPATHRPLARKVAKSINGGPKESSLTSPETNSSLGRVFMPRYRLAPQNPFPAALLDALVAYLYLLYPPPGALHKPVPASKIVIGGDSAGGNLAFSLLQLLLHLHRAGEGEDGYEIVPSSTAMHAPKLRWQGESRNVQLPGAVVGASAWVDLSRCFGEKFSLPDGTIGSEEGCKNWDYIPSPHEERGKKYKPSAAWPEDVGRSHFYAHDRLITHPLVSPITAKSWKGLPPVWMSIGDECLRDSNLYFAHRLIQSSVPLQFIKFTAMTHVFQITIPHLAVSGRSFDYLGEFVKVVFGRSKEMRLGEFRVHPVTLEEELLDREELKLGGIELEDVVALMRKEVEHWSGVVEAKL